jgi:3-phosphoshikimate 1-carboxyvinyltransferase
MVYTISKSPKNLIGQINLPTSKSESNRALIIQALSKNKFRIDKLSHSDDTLILNSILKHTESSTFDVGASGTAMRFLTAYFSQQSGSRILTGSERMKERPIRLLVEALIELGAEITYLDQKGFPPLEIKGRQIEGGEITIDGSMSSQYLSALALIAPCMPKGLKIKLSGEVISKPYLTMTLKMMESFGVKSSWKNSEINIANQVYNTNNLSSYEIEADWSSASYWYQIAAFSEEVDFKMMGLKKESLQGDAALVSYFEPLGVQTTFIEGGVHLSKKKVEIPVNNIHVELMNTPDIAQTLAVTYAAKEIYAELYGLRTLRIKETDRIKALITELKKIGVSPIDLDIGNLLIPKINKSIHAPKEAFKTYKDHRMAMCLAPLSMLFDSVQIENPEVVSKSYPDFWSDLKSVGFKID